VNDLFEGPAVSEQPGGDDAPSRTQKREIRAARKRAAKRRRRAIVAVVVALAIIGGGGYLVWARGSDFLAGIDLFGSSSNDDMADYTGPGVGEVQVTVVEGATGTSIADVLVENGVVASRGAFVAAYTANAKASTIQPGTYSLMQEMKASTAVEYLLDLNNRVDYIIDLRAGYSVATTITQMAKVTGLSEDEITTTMTDTTATGLPAEANGNYEGWLAPGLYMFGLDETPASMIAQMVTATVTNLDALGVATDQREEVLIKASIVEKESNRTQDRPSVASVIDNRLAIDMPLQMDSTIHYIFGNSEDATTTADQRSSDSPYNTYVKKGLPPTPISSPSVEALTAVVDHPDTDYLYFVTVNLDTGETRFATTLAEHQANVELLAQWREDNS
jgi:UPF0755 protein